jgi:hypothetical protein
MVVRVAKNMVMVRFRVVNENVDRVRLTIDVSMQMMNSFCVDSLSIMKLRTIPATRLAADLTMKR